MGGIWLQRVELLSTLSEHAGSKAGLALNARQLQRHLPDHKAALAGRGDQLLRVRSDELATMGAELLYALGNTPSPRPVFWPPHELIPRLQSDPAFASLADSMVTILKDQQAQSRPGPFDVEAFLREMARQHGKEGLELGFGLIDTFYQMQHQAVFSDYRRVEWADVAQLRDLFESEELKTAYGQFLDQRFLDYLTRNEQAVDAMNWRRFEGLAAEYFHRNGYKVALSKGRNDDNVDIRLWNPESKGAPLLLVQCKRQKAKVGKVIVKALYADVLHEGAGGGLIVTSSSLSIGAERTCLARGYPITEANRGTLREWLAAMQSPGAGVFMGT